ncbi:uncharacterized protein GGS22DRAFT_149317 [Annulohypoxylon maeteangense]|uniref:uncharacterized protein n=1 Tax=Annulohypoxylon maeteangense TaxID=1927788 RepID=UPI002007DE13|nr:uncharacterized protein GGS22DRAFT_149317 [Annulohypoxylon maeteangense]KAI0889860.1 hypothetical protein GGS22DRAFT_149317 [Annulohypoxylon maeteangense]
MFDRLRNAPKDRGAQQLNRKKLEAWQNSREQSSSAGRGVKGGDSQYQYSIRGGPAPPRPLRDPNNPPERHPNRQNYQPPPAVKPPNQPRHSGSLRPVSSVYSQPSPDAANFATQQLRLVVPDNDPIEISPPSSPDVLSPRDGPNPGDVSPIEELPDMSQLSVDPRGIPRSDARTNIPMMRRERRKNSDAAIKTLHESMSREKLKQPRPHGHDVRWNPATGEPTTDSKGRPSQVNPQEYAQGLLNQASSVSPPQVKKEKQGQITFGERLRRVRQPSGPSQAEPAPRPEWRGASGRTTLVAPVNDNKDVVPLKVPPKSSKRGGHESGALSPVQSVDSEPASSPVVRGLGISNQPTQPQSPASPSIAVTNSNANPHTYTSPSLSDDPTGNPQHQSLQIPANDKAIRRKPAGAPGHQAQPSWSSSIYSEDPRASIANPPPPIDTSLDGWTQPPSRFSVTTYATSSQQSATPRDSIDVDESAPPVPTPPQQFMAQQQQPSILDRKRPIVAGYDSPGSRKSSSPLEPVKISLDSYYMTSAVSRQRKTSPDAAVPRGNESQLSLASLSAKDKTLPLAPPETQSAQTQDRVAQLNAKLQALGNRRININTAIKQMTELMPTDRILASDAVIHKREEEKRKVESLKQELAEVERESYELGLKLHRAYKRLDRDAEFEPTTLWVRRVTGS